MQRIHLNELEQLEAFSEGDGWTEFRFIIEEENINFPVLVRIVPSQRDKLSVLYNGAIQRSKAPDGVVFQRSTWLEEINSCAIQFADPTLVNHPRLQIGWAQLGKESWAIESYVNILQVLRLHFSLAASGSTVHYGSSAGGFQAAAVGCLDVGSHVIVNNPQLDWSRYNQAFVKALLRDVFEGAEIEKIREESPWRVNVIDLFKREEYVPPMTLLTNLSSLGDFNNQLMPALEEMHEINVIGKAPKISIQPYYDENLGHNPLSKPVTLGFLNSKLQSL